MITGKVTSIYGKDIDTDDIIPASFLQQSTDRKFFKDYAFDRYDPAFGNAASRPPRMSSLAGKILPVARVVNRPCMPSKENNVVLSLPSPILIFFIAIRSVTAWC